MQRGYETTGKLWEKARSSVKSGEGAKITYLLSSGGCVTMVRRWASPSLQDAPCFHASKQHASRSLSENGKYAKNDQEGLKRSYHSFMSLEDFWKTFGRLLEDFDLNAFLVYVVLEDFSVLFSNTLFHLPWSETSMSHNTRPRFPAR